MPLRITREISSRAPKFERRHGLFQKPWRNSGIHQRAEKHIAADAGKTV